MKLSSPLPQPLPNECIKAAKIFKSFVDGGNNGLDGVIPRSVLENAKGFAIFTIFKAGFLFSARAGSGLVIAKLEDGTWSAPSAIGTAGVGFGGQAGAEMTDFLVVLNSRSALRSFMSAGSLTLGGNMSIAVGPLGRNGEAIGSLNTSGKVAAMYSYSKTKGLFGGISIEGSVIMERQDANASAYRSEVTVKRLLSGQVDPPEWASSLIQTLEACTGMPGQRKWVQDTETLGDGNYAFGGAQSPNNEGPSHLKKKKGSKSSFPPATWGKSKSSGSYFSPEFSDGSDSPAPPMQSNRASTSNNGVMKDWDAHFESDFAPDQKSNRHRPSFSTSHIPSGGGNYDAASPFNSLPPFHIAQSNLSSNGNAGGHSRSLSASSAYKPKSFPRSPSSNPFSLPSTNEYDEGIDSLPDPSDLPPYITPKSGLAAPLPPGEGVARAIALYNFQAVESGDLSFSKGDVITITKKSDSTDDWWKGKLDGKEGIFPANFVEVV